MPRREFVLAVQFLLGVIAAAALSACAQAAPARPNIVFILADDLGYGDVGAYGQTIIRTPNLDRMAAEGMRFTQHYAGSTVCAPSRASLLTGLTTGHGQIRGNLEFGGYLDEEERGQAPLSHSGMTVADILRGEGYATALIGKWGLGGPGTEGTPNQHGFDYFFGYLDQKQAHNHYPSHLWRNEERAPLNNPFIYPHPMELPNAIFEGDPEDEESYRRFQGAEYAEDRMLDEALGFVRRNRDRPFFLYYASALPHSSVQVPEEELEQYADIEESGPWLGPRYTPHRRPRAARAGMISRLDRDAGRILDELRALGIDERTLVVFTSDNGPATEGGQDVGYFDSAGGLRGLKRDLYEGGVRVPMIARWPNVIQAGATSAAISAFWDWMPTFAEVAGAPPPTETDGVSLLPALRGEDRALAHDRSLYWEFHEAYGPAQALRFGPWKVVRHFSGGFDERAHIELFNLDDDPGETRDVSATHPELVSRFGAMLASARTPSSVEGWNFDPQR